MRNFIVARWANAVVLLHDMVMALAAFWGAFGLRYGTYDITKFQVSNFFEIASLFVFFQCLCFLFFGLHRGIWRFASVSDLRLIMRASAVAVVVSFVGGFLVLRLESIPRSVIILDWLLLVMFLGGGRFFYRNLRGEKAQQQKRKKALVIGAGNAGEQLVREYMHNPASTPYQIIGFLDDDTRKLKRTIHGLSVLGATSDLERIVKDNGVEIAYLAIPSASRSEIRRFFDLCSSIGVKLNTLPRLIDIANGKVTFNQLREVDVEDLLGRDVVNLDTHNIGKMLSNRTVMVTGAGGSIGSELCRQILKFHPREILLLDNCEFFLYRIDEELRSLNLEPSIVPVIADVRNRVKMEHVFKTYQPEIVFHAAAYKHVPMMEAHPVEAIQTNVFGTKNTAELAVQYGVKTFVLVSTDKAVNPTNVMGTTKRIAEMVCQELQNANKTHFTTVRFGNVLGSNGSVIPKFKEQIERGGPITVTHPEITRFFMSIPEACQLVIQAGTLGRGGEIFVLDMGEPIKIVDLARDIIRLSGLKEGEDISIEFTGLRPGEKLYEELISDKESTLPTSHAQVRVACARAVGPEFEHKLIALNKIDYTSSEQTLKIRLKEIVLEYQPQFQQDQDSESVH